jgi:membrane dipeptidase
MAPAPPACCAALDGAGRRAFVAALLGAVAAACAGPTADGGRRRQQDLLRQGSAAIAGLAVVDLHAHPGAFTRARTGELPLAALEEMAAGGVGTAFFAAVGDGPVIRREGRAIRQYREPAPGELRASALGQLGRVRARAREGRLRLVLARGDVDTAGRGGAPAALLACEGGDPLEGDPRRVAELFAAGVRSIQLVHYRVNELGDIQTEPSRHGGLTAAGHGVVAEMNRLGLLVDGAHAAPDTLRAILAASRAPIIVSHTGPAARRAVARHLPDDLLRAVAARGGVIGVWPMAARPAGIEPFLDEIDHVRRVAGVEHVAVGTDMAGLATFTSIPTYREFAPVPAALLARGFSEGDVRRVLGGNAARVLAAALPAG